MPLREVSIFIHSLVCHPPQIGFIKPHPIVTQIQRVAMETKLTFDSYVMPMLCPPVPWTSPKSGAYLLTPTKLMRSTDGAIQHQLLLEKSRDEDLHAVLDSLNQVGNCPWKINKPLLDIIISIFNDKGQWQALHPSATVRSARGSSLQPSLTRPILRLRRPTWNGRVSKPRRRWRRCTASEWTHCISCPSPITWGTRSFGFHTIWTSEGVRTPGRLILTT